MANPLFQELNKTQATPNDGGFAQMMQEFQQFRNTFCGNAKQEVERLLKTGQMSQQQFQQLSQMANQMMGLMSR